MYWKLEFYLLVVHNLVPNKLRDKRIWSNCVAKDSLHLGSWQKNMNRIYLKTSSLLLNLILVNTQAVIHDIHHEYVVK